LKWKFGGNNRIRFAGLLILAAATLLVRLPGLEDRPMHTDEAVHACILGDLLASGRYHYNPGDYHGPTLYYLAWPLLKVLGAHSLADMDAWQLRLVPVLLSAALPLTLLLFAAEMETAALLGTAVFFTFAAPFVYYSRYFIHEILFVTLTLALLGCVWRFFQSARLGWAVATGFSAGLLLATKETGWLALAALLPATLLLSRGSTRPNTRQLCTALLLAMGTALLVLAMLYSSCGTHPAGLRDVWAALPRFWHRAGGQGHEKPWWTYLAWFFQPGFFSVPWSGWLIFSLSLFGLIRQWNNPLVRFACVFALLHLILYSLIPYKTPWLELNILAPLCLPAGAGLSDLCRQSGRCHKTAVWALLLPILFGLGTETRRLCFQEPADERNPLAYSPTVPDVNGLVQKLDDFASHSSKGRKNLIQVIGPDYWPLPWYLRRYPNVGYWQQTPDKCNGDAFITSPENAGPLREKLTGNWEGHPFGLRPEVLAILFLKNDPSVKAQ